MKHNWPAIQKRIESGEATQVSIAAELGITKQAVHDGLRYYHCLPRRIQTDPGETIASRLRHYRLRKGWSQPKLAKAVRVTQATVSNIECGQRPSLVMIARLCFVLDVRLSDFFAGIDESQLRA